MIYTKIENNMVFFRLENNDNNWKEISEIKKEDILFILEKILSDDSFELEDYDSNKIKNEVHNIIYQNLFANFNRVLNDKSNIIDENTSRYKDIIDKYKS